MAVCSYKMQRCLSLFNEKQVAQRTGADWVLYQELEDLEDAVREVNPDIPRFDSSCFR